MVRKTNCPRWSLDDQRVAEEKRVAGWTQEQTAAYMGRSRHSLQAKFKWRVRGQGAQAWNGRWRREADRVAHFRERKKTDHKPWTQQDYQLLREKISEGWLTCQIAAYLERTQAAIEGKRSEILRTERGEPKKWGGRRYNDDDDERYPTRGHNDRDVVRVPQDDPLLERLNRYHGADELVRDVPERRGTPLRFPAGATFAPSQSAIADFS